MRETYREDRKLVARLVKGDERAFDFFVDEYYPRLYRFAYTRLGRDADIAQDIVQNTFSKVIRKIGNYRGEAALFTWLCGFCRFEIAAYWRQKGKQAREVELVEDSPHARAALETLGALPEGTIAHFEREELAFFERVRACYLELARQDSGRYRVVAADAELAVVQAQVRACGEEFVAHWRGRENTP